MKYIIILSFIPALFITCCKPDPNLCENFKEPTGQFIYNSLAIYPYNLPNEVRYFDFGDTFLCYSNNGGLGYLELYALDTNCTYMWIYRSDTFRTKDLILSNLPSSQLIEISLQVTANDPNNCLSSDKKIKKTTRKFYGIVQSSAEDNRYYGKWKGSFLDSSNKEIVVEVKKQLSDSINYGNMRNIETKECYPNYYLNTNSPIDNLINLPFSKDIVSVSRYESGPSFSINQQSPISIRKLNILAVNNCYTVKNICSYNPFFYPSIYCLVTGTNEIAIIVVGEQYYDSKNPLFKRTFIGSRM